MRERYRRLMPFVLAVYLIAVAAIFFYFNLRLTVEWVAIVLFLAAIVSGRGVLFLRDWGVFITVLLTWQLASPLATQFSFPWHLQELITVDKFLFAGHVPAVWLQGRLYHPGHLMPWDVFAATMYMLHFLTPLAAGFALWLANRQLFRTFAITFVVVALAGWATYVLYPAVPPWLAAEPLVHVRNQYVLSPHGHVYLPGVTNVFNSIFRHWYNPYHGTIFFSALHMRYDQVGAIPSEHAAYPTLFMLFLRRQFGRIAYLALIYIAGILFAITYLGQHYIIDALVGFAYAGAGYASVVHVVPVVSRRLSRPRFAPRSSTVMEEA